MPYGWRSTLLLCVISGLVHRKAYNLSLRRSRVITTLLFDFDGTIADTLSPVIQALNRLSPVYGYRPVKQREIQRLRRLTMRELLKEFQVPLGKVPFITRRVRAELARDIPSLRLTAPLRGILLALRKRGYRLGIVSANSVENVRVFLDRHHLDQFEFIHSCRGLLGKHHALRAVLRQEKLCREEVLYIGDEVRDIEACRKAGIPIAAVSWGYNSSDILQKNQPDYLIKKPRDLLTILL